MEVKLGTHMYSIVSMTTTNKNPYALFLELLLHSSNLLMVARMELKRPPTESNDFLGGLPPFMCSIIIAHAYKNERRPVNKKILRIKERRAYRDGIKRKGDKIGMVSVVSSKMRMVSEEL